MEKSTKGLSRRSFLATTGVAAGAFLAASLAGCTDDEPTPTPEPTPVTPPEESYYISTCRGNCGGACALKATVREGKIVSTVPLVFPREEEGLQVGCAKGVTNPLRIYGPARMLYPMKRAGARGSGQWERITWDEALTELAGKMNAAVEQYGGWSVCWQVGAGNMYAYLNSCNTGCTLGFGVSRLAQKIGATMLSVGDDMAGIYMAMMLLRTPMNAAEDLANAKTIVAWGANPAEASFNRTTWNWICKGREAGAKLITLDPLYTSTAAHSDEWIPVRTGTDTALAIAMCNYIIENDWVDWDYMKNKSVAPLLINDEGKYLRLSTLGQAQAIAVVEDKGPLTYDTYDYSAAAKEGEDVPVVWDADANTFVAHTAAKNPEVHGEYTIDGVRYRTVFDAALEQMAPVTMEFAAEECGLPLEQIQRLAKTIATEGPTSLYVNYGLEHTYESWRVYFPISMLAALTGNVGIPGGSYRGGIGLDHTTATHFKKQVNVNLSEMTIPDAKPRKIITGDYLVEIMNTGKWAGQDFPVRVVIIETANPLDNFSGATDLLAAYNKIDCVVTIDTIMTTTAHWSDMVLPAAMPWESYEMTNTGLFGQKAIEPCGEAKQDFDIMKELAAKMGFTDLYPMDDLGYLRSLLDTPENIAAGVAFDDFFKNGVIPGDYKIGPMQNAEGNALGRTQFFLENMPPRDNWGQTFGLQDRLPFYKPSIEAYADNPDRAKYPLYGFSNHDLYHGQTLWIHNEWLNDFRKVNGKPFCRIHPTAADARGIKTGDTVRIFNDHGTCVLNALVTPGIREDSVWVPHGFAWDEFDEGFAQSLTRWCPDPVTSNSNFNDWICQVEKI